MTLDDVIAGHGFDPPTCMSELGSGWLGVVDEALGKLKSAGLGADGLAQIKQKIIRIRMRTAPGPRGSGWIRTLCDGCEPGGRPRAA